MSKNIRIRSRIDDKLKVQMDKKLSQKKFSNYDESKFIRAAIENFNNQNLFNYISNITTIVNMTNEMIIDINGLRGNISQVVDHLECAKDNDLNITIDNFLYCHKLTIDYVQEMKKLVRLLRPNERNWNKSNLVICRIDENTKLDIQKTISEYKHLKMNMSKFIRIAIKYYLDKRTFELSDKQIELARELMKCNTDIAVITDRINKMAFEMNCGKDIPKVDIYKAVGDLNDVLQEVHHVVTKLYDASLKFS